MKDAVVYGRFLDKNKQPVEGIVSFHPSKLWIDESGLDGDLSFATLAPTVTLVDGRFSIALSRTDTGPYPWHYTVICPMGRWSVYVDRDGPLRLKDLLPKANH